MTPNPEHPHAAECPHCGAAVRLEYAEGTPPHDLIIEVTYACGRRYKFNATTKQWDLITAA